MKITIQKNDVANIKKILKTKENANEVYIRCDANNTYFTVKNDNDDKVTVITSPAKSENKYVRPNFAIIANKTKLLNCIRNSNNYVVLAFENAGEMKVISAEKSMIEVVDTVEYISCDYAVFNHYSQEAEITLRNFNSIVKKVEFAISNENCRENLHCVNFKITQEKVFAMATNTRIGTIFEVGNNSNSAEPQQFVIKTNILELIKKSESLEVSKENSDKKRYLKTKEFIVEVNCKGDFPELFETAIQNHEGRETMGTLEMHASDTVYFRNFDSKKKITIEKVGENRVKISQENKQIIARNIQLKDTDYLEINSGSINNAITAIFNGTGKVVAEIKQETMFINTAKQKTIIVLVRDKKAQAEAA